MRKMYKWTAAMALGLFALTVTGCLENKQTGSSTEAVREDTKGGTADSKTEGADTQTVKTEPTGERKADAGKKAPVIYKFGNAGAVNEPAAIATQHFCDLVNERIGDEIYLEFYPAQQLGDEITMLQNLQTDLQQGVFCALDTLSNYSPDLGICSCAFVFESHDHLYRYLESDYGKEALKKLEDQGMYVMNYKFKMLPRIIFAKKAIMRPSDAKGLKFRVPNIPMFEKNVAAFGATPVVFSWADLPFALIQGVLDGSECTTENYYPNAFYESCPYVSELNYAYPAQQLCMSKASWERLTPEQQKVFEECADIAAETYNKTAEENWAKNRKELEEEKGVTFVEFDKQAFHDAMEPVYREIEESHFFDTPNLIEKVRALAK